MNIFETYSFFTATYSPKFIYLI